jgi:hypothetical protein
VTALVGVETVLLVVLLVLVVGLLRSHAEILRRLGAPAESGDPDTLKPAGSLLAPGPDRNTAAAPALAGATPAGDAIALDLAAHGPTLLAFLTTGCTSCARFWEELAERRLPAEVRTLIVTNDRDRESPSRLRKLAPAGIPVVMSSAAWSDYAVPGSPYFVLVDGVIRGEGMATSWEALASLVTDAIEDERAAQPGVRQVDDVFAAAGIGADHPSLYPGRSPT